MATARGAREQSGGRRRWIGARVDEGSRLRRHLETAGGRRLLDFGRGVVVGADRRHGVCPLATCVQTHSERVACGRLRASRLVFWTGERVEGSAAHEGGVRVSRVTTLPDESVERVDCCSIAADMPRVKRNDAGSSPSQRYEGGVVVAAGVNGTLPRTLAAPARSPHTPHAPAPCRGVIVGRSPMHETRFVPGGGGSTRPAGEQRRGLASGVMLPPICTPPAGEQRRPGSNEAAERAEMPRVSWRPERWERLANPPGVPGPPDRRSVLGLPAPERRSPPGVTPDSRSPQLLVLMDMSEAVDPRRSPEKVLLMLNLLMKPFSAAAAPELSLDALRIRTRHGAHNAWAADYWASAFAGCSVLSSAHLSVVVMSCLARPKSTSLTWHAPALKRQRGRVSTIRGERRGVRR